MGLIKGPPAPKLIRGPTFLFQILSSLDIAANRLSLIEDTL